MGVENNCKSGAQQRQPSGGIASYKVGKKTYWKISVWLPLPSGGRERFRKRKIPTREQAVALEAKKRAEAFEGRYFDRKKPVTMTVAGVWVLYEPVTKANNDSGPSDVGRAAHLLRHLGAKAAMDLTELDIDEYRAARRSENTVHKKPPEPATVDREVELLKRSFNYAARVKKLPFNPIARVKLLNHPNVRDKVIREDVFAKLLDVAEPGLKPVIQVGYDTGMRLEEVLDLVWARVNLRDGTINLMPQMTKTETGRVIFLTERAVGVLKMLPRSLKSNHVFINPNTGERWADIRKMWKRALKAAGLEGYWLHDLRRSFATNARRRGVPESVVMRMTGHKTRAVFDRYNIVEESDLRAAVQRIQAGASAELADATAATAAGGEKR